MVNVRCWRLRKGRKQKKRQAQEQEQEQIADVDAGAQRHHLMGVGKNEEVEASHGVWGSIGAMAIPLMLSSSPFLHGIALGTNENDNNSYLRPQLRGVRLGIRCHQCVLAFFNEKMAQKPGTPRWDTR